MPLDPKLLEEGRKADKRRAEQLRQQRQTPPPTQATAQEPKKEQPKQQPKRQPGEIEQAGKTAQKKTRDDGLVTQIGQGLEYVLGADGLTADMANTSAALLNKITPGASPFKPLTEGLDDFVRGSEEMKADKEMLNQDRIERREEGEGNALDPVLDTVEGVAEGMAGGIAMPFTVAARLANQNAPWSDPPAQLSGSPLGEIAFEITQIIVPTLLTQAVAPGMNPGLAVVGESAIETAAQDSAEDLIAGRTAAIKFGELADQLGFDGKQLTIDLIEGNKPNAQVINAIAGFFQNLGINMGANKIFNEIGKRMGRNADVLVEDQVVSEATQTVKPKATDGLDPMDLPEDAGGLIGRLRQVLKKDEVKQLNDLNEPTYRPDAEPHEVADVDTLVPTGKPSPGRQYISDPQLIARALSRNNLANDGMDAAGRNYFTNLKSITKDKGAYKALEEATKTLKRLRPAGMDIDELAFKAQAFLSRYVDEASVLDIDRAMADFVNSDFLVPIDPTVPKGDIKTNDLIYQKGQITQEGFIAASIMAEELGTRMAMAARQASNLDSAGIDFTKQVDNFIELNNLAQQLLIPLRRGKRRWAVEGFAQQKRVAENLQTPSETLNKDIRVTAESREFETQIKADPTKQGVTANELWLRYKGGDQEAGDLLKKYMAMIGTSRPSAAIANVENLGRALYSAMQRSSMEAGQRMYYAYMLTRLSPQQAALSSNILQLIKQPLGLFLNGDRAEAVGQFLGGWGAMQDAIHNAAVTFRTGKGLNVGNRTGQEVISLVQKNKELDLLYDGVRKQLARDNAPLNERIYARMMYLRQKMAATPIMDLANRGLMAQDEWAKTINASQYATGRAWKQAAEAGWGNFRTLGNNTTPEFQSLIQDSFNEAFKDGTPRSGILDPQILEGAKRITFQRQIPTSGNQVDKAFLALSDAAEGSMFWQWVSPFTRMSYETLEQAGIMLAGSIPMGVGRKALVELIPRYKKTLAGEFGPVAQMQLKSDMAFAEVWSYGIGGLAAMGMMTGHTPPEGMPKTSFIIPAPGTEQGWVGIPYGRLEPVATQMAVIADLITNFKSEIISEGDYTRFMEQTLFSLFLATFDKGFTSSLYETAALFDVKNWSDYTISTITRQGSAVAASQLPLGAYGGIGRMVSSWAVPYKTVDRVNDDPIENIFLALRSTFLSGAGNPVFYDPYTGKPEMKVATLGGNDNYWGAVIGSMFNEALVPGKVGDARSDEITRNFNEVNYKATNTSFRTWKNIPLTAEQISILTKDLYEHGKLPKRMKEYFTSSRYKNLRKELDKYRNDSPIKSTSDGTMAGVIRQTIHDDIRTIERQAVNAAVDFGRLSKDEDLQRKFRNKRLGLPLNTQPSVDNSLLIPTR